MNKLLLSVFLLLPAGLCASANNRLSAGDVANEVMRYKRAFNESVHFTDKEAALAEMLEYQGEGQVNYAINMHPKLEKLFGDAENAMRSVLDNMTRQARTQ